MPIKPPGACRPDRHTWQRGAQLQLSLPWRVPDGSAWLLTRWCSTCQLGECLHVLETRGHCTVKAWERWVGDQVWYGKAHEYGIWGERPGTERLMA